MTFGRLLLAFIIVVIAGVTGFMAYAWKPVIDPVTPPNRASFAPAMIETGAKLAALGNCTACHTRPGGRTFAGSFPVPTPFGTIYSSNITPDADTGIGRWSEAAFNRAMREGISRDGSHLYPAFPYDHFTLVSDQDNRALYAFLMTRTPVKESRPGNDLPFPLNNRMLLAGWKLLFFKPGAYRNDGSHDAEWNRGAYLAEGLGHCGACHTPRNQLGAEKTDAHFAGGEAEGWSAYAIDRTSPAPIPWDRDSLFAYLRQGWHPDHGVAIGPMAEVTGNLSVLPDSDIHAIATYVASLMGTPTQERLNKAKAIRDIVARSPITTASTVPASSQSTGNGMALYQAACAVCHDGTRALPFGGVSFHLSSTIAAPDPQNAINMLLFGLPAVNGRQSAVMPGFAATMNDQQAADLLAYLRATFSNAGPWADVAGRVAATRSGKYQVSIKPSDGIERGPDNIGAQDK